MAVLTARFVRKPVNLQAALAALADSFDLVLEWVSVGARRSLSIEEYDVFVAHFGAEQTWLEGQGGFRDGYRCVVEVIAPQRRTLYIDPSGGNYGRYVGFADVA